MDILGIGECMVELQAMADSKFSSQAAGDVFNTLAAAARLGNQTAFLSRVASDSFGNIILNACEAFGIDTQQVERVTKAQNGLYVATFRSDGSHEFLYYRKDSAASQLQPHQFTTALAQQCNIIYASGITQAISASARQTVLKAFQLGKQYGCTTVFDLNYRTKLWQQPEHAVSALSEILPYVDILLPSQEDITDLLNLASTDQALTYFHEKGAAIVVLKQGKHDILLSLKQPFKTLQQTIPIFPAPSIQDTIGAGDAFNGGFLHGLLHQQSLVDCVRYGSITAALSLGKHGPTQGLPTAAEVEELFIASNTKIDQPSLANGVFLLE